MTAGDGSGLVKAPQRMQALALGAKALAGGLLNGRSSQSELAAWAEKALEA